MIYPAKSDIVPLVRGLTAALQSYACVNEVTLVFKSSERKIIAFYEPASVINALSHLICQIINLVPPQSSITIRLLHQIQDVLIEVENTSINLLPVTNITLQGRYTFKCHPLTDGTLYQLHLPVELVAEGGIDHFNPASNNVTPKFYTAMRKRLRSHFTLPEKQIAVIAETRPEEASFLQKINALIKANLNEEQFDTAALCKAMAMSRTQLFRRLKPLIGQAPANYIKEMRLQNAKHLLDTTELTVSEVAFRSGFATVSHFSKIFLKKYGLNPSLFRRNKPATNE